MPLDPQAIIDELSAVQRLVFGWARYDESDAEWMRVELYTARREAYADELEIQAARVGCAKRKARVTNTGVLEELNRLSERDAKSIVNTYNYYLAKQLIAIREQNIRGNRYYYAAKLRDWDAHYWQAKDKQVATQTDGSARAKAQQDFYRFMFRGMFGTAKLEPRTAVCPVCKGWIKRGVVPLRVALNNPPPYHVGCPHTWDTRPGKVAEDDCPLLWMGE